jgi:heterodisulfide reductase subunit D
MSEREEAFLTTLDRRVDEILARCTGCGRCVEVCPTAEPAGIDKRAARRIVAEVLEVLAGGGRHDSAGARWAETCTGSGACIGACDDGVNPRFMLAMTRLRLDRQTEAARRARGQQAFHAMSQTVKVLSRLQLPAPLVGEITRSGQAAGGPAPEVVLYLGCNVLRTPHIALLCMDVLDRIGARYRVLGGPANCCGVLQFRAGDPATAGRIAGNTVEGFRRTGASQVLTWCPTCNIQLGEVVMSGAAAELPLGHVIPYIAERLDRLRTHLTRPVHRRVALHEHPGVARVTESVVAILRAIPGLELVDLEQPRVGYMCNSLAPLPAYKRELQARELQAAEAAGVDSLVGIYHACHRELCGHEAVRPFRVVNFLELVGESMGVGREDLFKQWKTMQDIDRVLAEVAPLSAAAGVDLELVREVLVGTVLGEHPVPLASRGV